MMSLLSMGDFLSGVVGVLDATLALNMDSWWFMAAPKGDPTGDMCSL